MVPLAYSIHFLLNCHYFREQPPQLFINRSHGRMIGLRAISSMKQGHVGMKEIAAASTHGNNADSTQMQQLLLLESDNSSFSSPGNNADSLALVPVVAAVPPTNCLHGFGRSHESVNQEFVDAFMNAYNDSSSQFMGANLVHAINETAEKYDENVWESPTEMEVVVSFFVDKGVKALLEGDNENAQRFAVFASYLERS